MLCKDAHQWRILSICRIIILLNDVLAFAILMVSVNQDTDVYYVIISIWCAIICPQYCIYVATSKNNEQYIVSASLGTSHLVCLSILLVILPCFVCDAVIQYFLSPLLIAHGFLSTLLSNILYAVALSYYHYLNFLGYDGNFCLPFWAADFFWLLSSSSWSLHFIEDFGDLSGKSNLLSLSVSLWVAVLPFLERTTFFLYPIGLVVILFPFCKFSDDNIFPTFGFPVVYQYYFANC